MTFRATVCTRPQASGELGRGGRTREIPHQSSAVIAEARDGRRRRMLQLGETGANGRANRLKAAVRQRLFRSMEAAANFGWVNEQDRRAAGAAKTETSRRRRAEARGAQRDAGQEF